MKEQSDLGLHCLPEPICPKIKDRYGIAEQTAAIGASNHCLYCLPVHLHFWSHFPMV